MPLLRRVVVSYDITDDKRRDAVFKILQGYGRHVQFSLFECRLRQEDVLRMQNEVVEKILKDEDSVVYYFLCEDCARRIERIGVEKAFSTDEETMII